MDMLKSLGSPQGRFFTACTEGDKQTLKKILANVDIDAYSPDGLTGGHLAVQHGRTDILELLLDAQINLKAEVQRGELAGYTVTHLAAMLPGRSSCLQLLLRKGTSHVRTKQGWTPLHCAAFSGRFESVRLLLEADCNPDVQTQEGRTPLMMASSTAMVKIVRLLLGTACDTSILDYGGKYSALEHALDIRSFKILPGNVLRAEAYECAYLLILSGASVTNHSEEGGPFRYLGEDWSTLFNMVAKYRVELLRGGALPFAGFGGATLAGPCGMSFQELLTAESYVLDSLGLVYADVRKLVAIMPNLWAQISRSTAALSPHRRSHNKPTPPTNFSVSRLRWLTNKLTNLRTRLPARIQTFLLASVLFLFFWAGAMAERYKQNPLLFIAMFLLPDPFDAPVDDDATTD